MLEGSNDVQLNAPLIVRAVPEEVPLIDANQLSEWFPNKRFVFAEFEGVHEFDFEFFGEMDSNITFCDIGANIGQSIDTLRNFGSKAILHSFEINPICWPILEKKSRKYNGIISIYKFGLGETSGKFELFIPIYGDVAVSTLGTLNLTALQTDHLLGVLQSLISGPEWRVVKILVDVKTFDSLGIEPDFVKIDVEGLEAGVLRGMTNTLNRKRPALLIEDTNPLAVQSVLAPLGYLPCSWDGETKSLYLSYGKSGNSIYLHATDILDMMMGRSKHRLQLIVQNQRRQKILSFIRRVKRGVFRRLKLIIPQRSK
jgi:FkbM family methyltransferase